MRLTTYILTILILTISFGFRTTTNPISIYGHLKNNTNEKSIYNSGLIVFVKADGKILAQDTTNESGDFVLEFLPEKKEKHFDFFCCGIGMNTILISSVSIFESDTPEMTFYIPRKISRNVFGKFICTLCKRTDKVYKIRHSDAPVSTFQISKSGDTTYSQIYKGKYQVGCLGGPATYYCDRDKVKF